MAIRRRPPDPKPVDVRLGHLVLGYSDLTSLMNLLASRVGDFKIEAGEKKISNIGDLYSASRSERAALIIRTTSPNTTIYLCAGNARVEIADTSPAGINLAGEVLTHLEHRRQRAPVGIGSILLYGALTAFVVAIISFVHSLVTSPKTAMIATGVLAAFTLLVLLTTGSNLHSSGSVSLKLGERPTSVEKTQLRYLCELPKHVTAFRLGFIRLYLDDIDDIASILSMRGKSVHLYAGSAKLDSANDLRNTTSDELANLVFESRKPHVRVEICQQRTIVYALEDTSKAISLADDIARLIARRATRFPVGHPDIPIVVALSIGLLTSAPTVIWPNVSIIDRIGVVTYAVLLPLLSASFYSLARVTGGAKIYRTDRAGRIDMQRSWRQMWISATIGATISVALTWWQLRS